MAAYQALLGIILSPLDAFHTIEFTSRNFFSSSEELYKQLAVENIINSEH